LPSLSPPGNGGNNDVFIVGFQRRVVPIVIGGFEFPHPVLHDFSDRRGVRCSLPVFREFVRLDNEVECDLAQPVEITNPIF
jgi:hypothetical protein